MHFCQADWATAKPRSGHETQGTTPFNVTFESFSKERDALAS
jgi:hypothetical protein